MKVSSKLKEIIVVFVNHVEFVHLDSSVRDLATTEFLNGAATALEVVAPFSAVSHEIRNLVVKKEFDSNRYAYIKSLTEG